MAAGGRIDYAKIVLPQYCPEIVPSRRTRESNNTILQSHDGLKFHRSSSDYDLSRSSDSWRKFDYARLDFAPPSSQNALLRRNDREDYVNLKEGEDVISASRRHSDCYVNLRERDDIGGASQVRPRSHCYVNQKQGGDISNAAQVRPTSDGYVNVGANRQSDIHFVRRASANIDSRTPRPAHLGLSRWQSERTARSRRSSAERERAQHDYQNVKPASPHQGQEKLPTAAASVPLSRTSSTTVPERNPTTGEYQNLLQEEGKKSGTSSPSPMLLSPDISQNLFMGPRRHRSELRSSPMQHSCKVSRSVSMRNGEEGCVSRKPLPPFTSRKVDYENLWYLGPDPHDSSLESYNSEDNCCSSDEEQSMRDKKALWRSSTVSVEPDYYDHLSPMMTRSGSFVQNSSGSISSGSFYLESEVEDRSYGTSVASSRSSPESVSLAGSVGGLKPSPHGRETRDTVLGPSSKNIQKPASAVAKDAGSVTAGCEEGNHLGRFKLRYMGQCPIDRFLGPVDVCAREVIKSSHQSTKDVHADVSLTGIKLTPLDSGLLFASFGTEHILSISSCAKNKRFVGIIFKRSRGRCVCHLFRCRDDVTPRILISTVNKALVSISRKAMRKLKEQAVEIEKSSVIPADLFGSVRYLGSRIIVPQELITNGIEEALKVSMMPSALRDVILSLRTRSGPERGLFEMRENAGEEPILTSPVAEIDIVGCYVVDRRYVGMRMLDKKQGLPTIHILHFGQAVGAAAFLAVMRDKFGVTVDEGEFFSCSRQPTLKGLVTSAHQFVPVPGNSPMISGTQAHKGQGIRRKLTFKDFICSRGHHHS